MTNHSLNQAKRCLTATGFLIEGEKILLVLHKKLKIWLAPGGHVEEDELPHTAAEREVWEETGLKVKAISSYPVLDGMGSEYLPLPFSINLHWISKENYQKRMSAQASERVRTQLWPMGCEQHWVMTYLVKPLAGTEFRQNVEEVEDMGWFTLKEVEALGTSEDIKQEIKAAFALRNSLK